MSETKHTPLPWRADGKVVRPDGSQPRKAPIARTDLSHGLGEAGEEDGANAAFIVRAVNAHAALLAACEKMLARHEQALAIRVKLTGISTGALADEIAAARAAVAAARGA